MDWRIFLASPYQANTFPALVSRLEATSHSTSLLPTLAGERIAKDNKLSKRVTIKARKPCVSLKRKVCCNTLKARVMAKRIPMLAMQVP